jgi:microcystin-dependent protein
MPAHTHTASCQSAGGDSNSPVNRFWSRDLGTQSGTYHSAANATMNPAALTSAGSNQPHTNMPPFLVVNFIIALQGIFPPRS